MKFVHKTRIEGRRYRTRSFLWLPMCIGNETRWLETATYEYTYVKPLRMIYKEQDCEWCPNNFNEPRDFDTGRYGKGWDKNGKRIRPEWLKSKIKETEV